MDMPEQSPRHRGRRNWRLDWRLSRLRRSQSIPLKTATTQPMGALAMIPAWLIWSAILCTVAIIAFFLGAIFGADQALADFKRRYGAEEDDF